MRALRSIVDKYLTSRNAISLALSLLHRVAEVTSTASNGFRAGASPSHGQTPVKIGLVASLSWSRTPFTCGDMEPMTGIEPAYSAWEADVLPLNYIGAVVMTCGNSDQRAWPRTECSQDVTTRSKLAPASRSAANWL